MDQKVAPVPAARKGRKPRAEPDAGIPRERILRAAARLFREKGYKGTTVREIAEEVGLLSGSLFHHFATKEDILLEIMREAFLSVCIRGEEILLREADPVRQLRELLRLELNSIVNDERKDYHVVLYFDWRDAPEAAKPELNRYRKRYQRCWQRPLEECAALGKLRCDPSAANHIIHGTLRGVMTWFKPGGRYTVEEFGDILLHLVLD
jgi:TetR/AcrR family transcriptional regulator, cholesterol catabolism regulator